MVLPHPSALESLHMPKTTSHKQSMEAPYILDTKYQAQTHGKESTQILNTFTCAVGGPSELWTWCCTDY